MGAALFYVLYQQALTFNGLCLNLIVINGLLHSSFDRLTGAQVSY